MTIKDIAKLSGYGVGTVSRVLNNHPDVSDKARERIMAIVQAEGFQPNSNARHLKMQAQSAIAVLVKGTQNMLFADILERIQSVLCDNDEEAYVAYLDEDADEVQYAVQLCLVRRPKGLIFLGGDLENFRAGFHRITVPCVLLTNDASALGFPLLSSFTVDDRAAAKAVIDFLFENGHRRIGILGGNLSAEQISCSRLAGVHRAMQANGLTFCPQQYQPCRFSMQSGYQAALQLFQHNPDITAVFALSDTIALGAMRAAREMGYSIPQDISIVGYDDISFAEFSYPRLTTIRQDTAALAERGVHTLLEHLAHTAAPVHSIIPFRLCLRESVQSRADKHDI